jgi:hypothetical protein
MAQVPIDHSIAPRMNSITYYQRGGGLRKVQMTVTLTILLSSKRYGNPQVSYSFCLKNGS